MTPQEIGPTGKSTRSAAAGSGSGLSASLIRRVSAHKSVRLYTFALIAVLLYGLAPMFTKVAVGSTDGITVGALRATVAFPIAVVLILAMRLPLPWQGNDKWLLLLSGAGGLAVFPILFSWGVQLTSAGHAAAGMASGAVVAGILGAWLNRCWPSLYWWAGIVIGMSGALLLIWEAVGLEIDGVAWQGDALVFAGMFCGVAGYVAGAQLTRKVGASAVTMWSVCIAVLLLLPIIVWKADAMTISSIDPSGWIAISVLAWGTTICAYLLWNRTMAEGGVARIGSLQMLQPVIGIGVAPLFLNEPLTMLLAGATVITLLGVVLIQRG